MSSQKRKNRIFDSVEAIFKQKKPCGHARLLCSPQWRFSEPIHRKIKKNWKFWREPPMIYCFLK